MNPRRCKLALKEIKRDRRMYIRIHHDSSRIEAVVGFSDHQKAPLTGKIWELEDEGIGVYCRCAKPCGNDTLIRPESPQYIEAQISREVDKFRQKFGVHPNRVAILMVNGSLQPSSSVNTFELHGDWKNRSLIRKIQKRFDALSDDKYEVKEDPSALYSRLIGLAQDHMRRREFSEAEDILKEAIRTISTPLAYHCLGGVYKEQGRLAQAEKALNTALIHLKRISDSDQAYEGTLYKQIEEEIKLIKGLREERRREKDDLKKQIKRDIEPEGDYRPRIMVSTQFDDSNQEILAALANGRFEESSSFNLLLQAQRISLLQGFEHLLCLESVNIEHYQYQIETARKVLNKFAGRAILADEVGLGKTIEAGLVLKEYFIRGLVSKVLILSVPSLVSQWKEEMESKFGLRFVTTDDPEFDTKDTNFWSCHDLIIASLAIARRENHRRAIHQLEHDLLIIDEAHHLKSRSTISWQFVNEIKRKFVLLLTATPIQNSLEELYNMITILKPGQLKTLTAFKRNFVTRGNSKKPKNKEQLRELLTGVMIRNTRSQVDIKLPKRHARTVKMHLLPPEMAIYQHVSDFVRHEYSSSQDKRGLNRFLLMMLQREIGSSVLAVLPTLRKMSENPMIDEIRKRRLLELYEEARGVNEATKIDALLKILNSVNPEKCLVFTQFLETQRLIQRHLHQAGIATSIFNGQMSSADKNLSIKEFQDSSRVLVSTEAGGEGRNLQFCHIMLNYDLPWNPMRIEQRVGRIHRVGQTKETYIFNLSSQDTIESYILRLLDEKINMFELVIGEMDMILGNLDEDRDFEETIIEIWTNSRSRDELEEKIEEFGDRLESAKEGYLEIKKLDEALFGEDYEVG